MELNELFTREPMNPIFESIFSDSERKELLNHRVSFISEYISRDDNLSVLKYKINKAFNFDCHPHETYLYFEQAFTSDIRAYYGNEILTKKELLTLFENQGKTEFADVVKNSEQDIYEFSEIYKLFYNGMSHISENIKVPMPLRYINKNIHFQVNPYKYEALPEKAYSKYNDSFETLNNLLLLDYGGITNNTIYVCIAPEMIEYSKQMGLDTYAEQFMLKLYFPMLQQHNITDIDSYNLNINGLRTQYSPETFEKLIEIDSIYLDLYEDSENIGFLNNGVQQATAILEPHGMKHLSLDNLFKRLNSSSSFPIIKYNPGRSQENLYRLYAEKYTRKGKKIPSIDKASVFKFIRKTLKYKCISILHVIDNKTTIVIEIDRNSVIHCNVACAKNVFIDNKKIKLLFSDILRALFDLSQVHSEFETNYPSITENIKITNVNYSCICKTSGKVNVEKYASFLSPCFNVIESQLTKGIKLRYKKVSNFQEMDSIEAYITEKRNMGHSNENIIESMVSSFTGVNLVQATDYVEKFLDNQSLQQSLFSDKIVRIKNNPGFGISIDIINPNTIQVLVNNITNYEYLELIENNIKLFLYVTQSKQVPSLIKKFVKMPVVSTSKEKDITAYGTKGTNDDAENDENDSNKFQNTTVFKSKTEKSKSDMSKFSFLFDDSDEEDSDDGDDGNDDHDNNTEQSFKPISTHLNDLVISPIPKSEHHNNSKVRSLVNMSETFLFDTTTNKTSEKKKINENEQETPEPTPDPEPQPDVNNNIDERSLVSMTNSVDVEDNDEKKQVSPVLVRNHLCS